MSGPPGEVVIGLEVHARLATASKLFCRCPNAADAPPNTLICPWCSGAPGALPVLNRRAVECGLLAALALQCEPAGRLVFDRKCYASPDLPKGYQITQFREPLGRDGQLQFAAAADDSLSTVSLSAVQLEEDAGKVVHPEGQALSLVDLNRAGVPLIEVVTGPELHSPEDAVRCLAELRRLLVHTGVSTATMEQGGLRCDANVSLRTAEGAFGPRSEIKNLNSFRQLGAALAFEIERRRTLGPEAVGDQTRGFDPTCGTTFLLRDKQSAPDYRFYPEPDVTPRPLQAELVDGLRQRVPEAPLARRLRLQRSHGLSADEAGALVESPALCAYFDRMLALVDRPADGARWILASVRPLAATQGVSVTECALTPERSGEILGLVANGRLTARAARELAPRLAASALTATALAGELGWLIVEDDDELARLIEQTLHTESEWVRRYGDGEHQLLDALLGVLLRAGGGSVDPARARERLRRHLGGEAVP